MRVAIVGAGWYGCHIASFMRNLDFSVSIFERNDEIFAEASGNNQNRLHLGFHYARDYDTRIQSRDGYNRFMERYGALTEPVENNLYAVPRGKSLIDFRTYKMIMASSGIEFEEKSLDSLPVDIRGVSGVINTRERLIKVCDAKNHFLASLGDALVTGHPVGREDVEVRGDCVAVMGERFDYLIDATWSKLFPYSAELFYEPTLLLYYESCLPTFALTMVDGPLASIYPTEKEGVYTLSSVSLTPLGRFDDARAAEVRIASINTGEIGEIRKCMEAEIAEFYPKFREHFKYAGPQLSIKTKPAGLESNRACYVERSGRIFKIMSGKIDTIFVAAERVVSEISYIK